MENNRFWGESAPEIFAYALAAPILIGPAIVVAQCIAWLKTGEWQPVPASAAFEYYKIQIPSAEWVGVQKVLNVALDLPLSIVLFALWMGVIVLVVGTAQKVQDARRRKAGREH